MPAPGHPVGGPTKESLQRQVDYWRNQAASNKTVGWRSELADVLDRLGTVDRSKSVTFNNLDELIFQLRKQQ